MRSQQSVIDNYVFHSLREHDKPNVKILVSFYVNFRSIFDLMWFN